MLFNLSKFMAYETRDPFVSRQVRWRASLRRKTERARTAAAAAAPLLPAQPTPHPIICSPPLQSGAPPRLQEREDGLTDWDRFARAEYLRLAMEEDADADAASDGAWSRLDAL